MKIRMIGRRRGSTRGGKITGRGRCDPKDTGILIETSRRCKKHVCGSDGAWAGPKMIQMEL